MLTLEKSEHIKSSFYDDIVERLDTLKQAYDDTGEETNSESSFHEYTGETRTHLSKLS